MSVIFNASIDSPDEFLKAHRPSSNTPTIDGWIWCRLRESSEFIDISKFEKEGSEIVDELIHECERIKGEEPIRANKKLGKDSQKEWRDRAYTKFDRKVKKLAIETNLLNGKWLLYSTEERIDDIWGKIVKAYVNDGPLAKAGSITAKVACSLEEDNSAYVICVYCENSFDEEAVKKILDALINDIGIAPVAYKTDANTMLNINSKHVSGIKSSLYTTSNFFTKDQISAIFNAKSKAKEAVRMTATEEEEGGVEIGVQESSDEDDEPRAKRQKK